MTKSPPAVVEYGMGAASSRSLLNSTWRFPLATPLSLLASSLVLSVSVSLEPRNQLLHADVAADLVKAAAGSMTAVTIQRSIILAFFQRWAFFERHWNDP